MGISPFFSMITTDFASLRTWHSFVFQCNVWCEVIVSCFSIQRLLQILWSLKQAFWYLGSFHVYLYGTSPQTRFLLVNKESKHYGILLQEHRRLEGLLNLGCLVESLATIHLAPRAQKLVRSLWLNHLKQFILPQEHKLLISLKLQMSGWITCNNSLCSMKAETCKVSQTLLASFEQQFIIASSANRFLEEILMVLVPVILSCHSYCCNSW